MSAGLTPLGRKPRSAPVRLALAYNAGRIASYAVAGTIAGAFGALIDRVPLKFRRSDLYNDRGQIVFSAPLITPAFHFFA